MSMTEYKIVLLLHISQIIFLISSVASHLQIEECLVQMRAVLSKSTLCDHENALQLCSSTQHSLSIGALGAGELQ